MDSVSEMIKGFERLLGINQGLEESERRIFRFDTLPMVKDSTVEMYSGEFVYDAKSKEEKAFYFKSRGRLENA